MALYWVFTERCDGSAFTVSGCCSAAVIARADFHSGPYDTWAAATTVRNDINNPKPKPITAEDLRVGQTWYFPKAPSPLWRRIVDIVHGQVQYRIWVEQKGETDSNTVPGRLDLSEFLTQIEKYKAEQVQPKPQPAPSIWTDLDVRTAANAAANEISKAGLTKLSVLEISERVFSAYGKYLVGTQVRDLSGSLILNHINPAEFHPPTRQSEDRTMGYVRNALNAQADLIKSRGAQTVELNVKNPVVVGSANRHLQAALDQTMAERDAARKELEETKKARDWYSKQRDEYARGVIQAREERDQARKELEEIRKDRDVLQKLRLAAGNELSQVRSLVQGWSKSILGAVEDVVKERDSVRRERDQARMAIAEAQQHLWDYPQSCPFVMRAQQALRRG